MQGWFQLSCPVGRRISPPRLAIGMQISIGTDAATREVRYPGMGICRVMDCKGRGADGRAYRGDGMEWMGDGAVCFVAGENVCGSPDPAELRASLRRQRQFWLLFPT